MVCFMLCIGISASAAEIIDEGFCGAEGDNVSWVLYDDNNLVISGTGAISDYDNFYEFSPFFSLYIKNVVIEDGVTSIGEGVFEYCHQLVNITIPDSVTSIGAKAFLYCYNLTDITIPDSVTSIGEVAFFNCTGLTGITVDTNNKYYTNDSNGVLFNKDMTQIILYPAKSDLTTYNIPESVTEISDGAFYGNTDYSDLRGFDFVVDR